MDPASMTFPEFYRFYLSQHLHPMTRASHVGGMTLGWVCVLAAVVTSTPWLVVGLPLFGYLGAIPSHFIWEKNRPASFISLKAFVWSIGGDFCQFVSFYTGRLPKQVAEVKRIYAT
jgi:hypothetical protein